MPVIHEIEQNQPAFLQWRHALHQHPGLGFEEEFAARFVEQKLREFGFDAVHTQIGKTGIVGVLKGNRASEHIIGLRADMDALPIQEENDFAHRSTVAGKMHACGHDGHTASLLAAAWHLAQTRNFSGTVIFIFQPAEEGLGGGLSMIQDGLFERFPCRRIYAYHNMPNVTKGHILMREGALMAGSFFFDIQIQSQGGHAAYPHLATDPGLIMSHIYLSAQSIVAQNLPAAESGVLTFTDSRAVSNSYNVIPDSAQMKGCLRFFNQEIGRLMQQRLEQICQQTAQMYGGSATITFQETFIPLLNDPHATDIAAQAAARVVGKTNVTTDVDPVMGSEDFAFMLEEVPGCYVAIGAGESQNLHHHQYDFDDDLIPIAASFFCELVQVELN